MLCACKRFPFPRAVLRRAAARALAAAAEAADAARMEGRTVPDGCESARHTQQRRCVRCWAWQRARLRQAAAASQHAR
jgi:hypothetical protein